METEGSAKAALWKSATKLQEGKLKCYATIDDVLVYFIAHVFFSSSTPAEVENAKWGLQGGQAHNISTIHPEWNPLSHALRHPQCHTLCQSPLITGS